MNLIKLLKKRDVRRMVEYVAVFSFAVILRQNHMPASVPAIILFVIVMIIESIVANTDSGEKGNNS